MKLKISQFALVAGAALVAAGTPASAADLVKIGFAAPLTGTQSNYGTDMQKGVQLAIDDFNATKPVIGGKPVTFTLDSQDDQADPRTGTTVAQRLIDDGVSGIIGHFNSGTSIPASDLYERAGLPQVSMATSPQYTARGYKTTFRLLTSDAQAGRIVGSYVVNTLHYKRVAIIDDRTAYGQGIADEFAAAVQKAGGTIVKRDFTNDKALDFSAILTNLKGMNPDAVFYGGGDAQSSPMIRKMRQLGIKAAFVTGEMSKSPTFLKVGGEAAEGAIVYMGGLPKEKMPGFAGFEQRYKARFKEEVVTYSPYSYDGTIALLTAMKNANSTDPKVYGPYLDKVSIKGVSAATIAYDPKGDLRDAPVTIYRVDHGAFKPVDTIAGN
ncbi:MULTISPECIES: branched-chain amino acid ABC transporter substrate-binding protein [Burkholderia]|uniref:Branched-chain amino acid ABC transporter substrate-binding protein n=2 Tax=Burkholderia gladioli TaxID=28095 RepID=A0A0M2Q7X4_BURGA|nr:branched-chain amino acid ABC transporter substrate-binding protein [Burkholderia gladioli]NIE88255.1 branched-chain amino acid ABC transporter substrate-binding protein [Burkholderia sp. Tr-860]NIF67618.1 branched-chain amino acid ABC transporter substrate-binding protein [Burkholderia sp. Cy-647]NIF92929.1 branched-chain amino acid ABC transporter substrate-binding protein [Burkholderia sp. Cy-637]NIF98562.1 branched-chain amino acid ABC transporter substrate-binding protein [Burkholderia 